MYCRTCGQLNKNTSQFCKSCGQRLQQVPSQAHTRIGQTPGPGQAAPPAAQPQVTGQTKRQTARLVAVCLLAAILMLAAILGWKLASGSLDRRKVLAEVTSASGTVNLHDAVIRLDNDQNTRQCNITAREIERVNTDAESRYSSIYELEGYWLAYEGHVSIEMPLPEELLQDRDLANHLVICYTESGENDHDAYYTTQLQGIVDIERGCVRVELVFDQPVSAQLAASCSPVISYSGRQSGQASPDYSQSPRFDWSQLKEGQTPRSKIAFSYTYSGLFSVDKIVQTEDYRIIVDDVSAADIYFSDLFPLVIDYLDETRAAAELAGFSMAGLQKPLDVYIRDIEQSGRFEVSSLFRNQYHLVLAKRFFIKDYEVSYDKEEQYRKLKVLVGHELLHAGQYLIHKDQAFWMHEELSWMKEATARWFEARIHSSPAYLDETVMANTDFIHKSLYLNGSLADQYGAAFLMFFLQDKIPAPTLMASLFGNSVAAWQESGSWTHYPDNIAVAGIDRAARQAGTSMEALWVEFAARYYTAPQTIHSRLKTTDIRDSITMTSRDIGNDDRQYNFEPNLALNKGRVVYRTAGSVNNQTDTVICYEQTLPNLSAVCTDLQIRAANGAYDAPGKLVIQVESDEKAGVMVYGVRGQSYAGHNAYLSSNGTDTLVLDTFSSIQTGDLSLIAFSHDWSSNSTGSTVRIRISYTPDTLPEPTPSPGNTTTEPSESGSDGTADSGHGKVLRPGIFDGIGVGYWEEDWLGSRIRFEASTMHDGQYELAGDGTCSFGYVRWNGDNRIIYSRHYGTYEVMKTDTVRKGRLTITENGTRLPDAVHTIQYVRISYTHSIATATGERTEWESGEDIVIVDGQYILTGYGFNAYEKTSP